MQAWHFRYILDVISTTEELGKPVKSDEKNNKTTYVTIYGLDGASKLVEEYSHTAMTLLDQVCPNASFLKRLFEYLIVRKKQALFSNQMMLKGAVYGT